MQPSHPLGVGLSRGWGLIFQSRNFAQWGVLGYDKHDKHSLITIRLRVRPLYRGRKPVFCPSPRPRGVGQKMKINFQDSSPRAFQKCIGSLCLGHGSGCLPLLYFPIFLYFFLYFTKSSYISYILGTKSSKRFFVNKNVNCLLRNAFL